MSQIPTWDRKLIEELYAKCYPSISKWVRNNSGNEKEAEDVFQDAMIIVYQKSKSPSFQLSAKLTTFLFSVAKNIWLDRLRKKGRQVLTDFSEEDSSLTDEKSINDLLFENDIERVYRRAFDKLSDECKQVLTYFFNGYSMKEIEKLMGYKKGSMVRKRKFNCKNELVEIVKGDPLYNELRIVH